MTTTVTSLENEIVHLSRRAKGASRRLAGLSTEAKNSLLENLADRLSQPDTREKLLGGPTPGTWKPEFERGSPAPCWIA